MGIPTKAESSTAQAEKFYADKYNINIKIIRRKNMKSIRAKVDGNTLVISCGTTVPLLKEDMRYYVRQDEAKRNYASFVGLIEKAITKFGEDFERGSEPSVFEHKMTNAELSEYLTEEYDVPISF